MSAQGNDRTPDSRNADSRRDAAIEKLLSRRSGAMVSPATPCPDAEVLAAYAAHALGDSEATRWETHFATCERCQDILAALATSMPVEESEQEYAVAAASSAAPIAVAQPAVAARAQETPTIIKPARSRSRFWIAGIAAAAAIAYFAILRPSPNPANPPGQSATEIATQNQNQPVASAPPSDVANNGYVPVPQAADSHLPKTNAKAGKTSNRPVNLQDATREPQIALNPVVSTPVGNAGALPPAQAPTESRSTGGAVGGIAAGNAGTPVVAPEARRETAASAPAAPARADESLAKKQSEDKISSTVSNPNAQSQQNLDQAIAASQGQANTQQPAPQQSVSRMTSSGNFKSRARDAGALSNISAVLIFPTQGRSEWSIGENGRIDKSTDSGGTWQHQQSGVHSQLLAGSAPNDLVCWVVGRDGVILRTVDGGATWTKIPGPQSLNGLNPDWTGVFTTDAQHARISSVDGKHFSTSDGGQTWTADTP